MISDYNIEEAFDEIEKILIMWYFLHYTLDNNHLNPGSKPFPVKAQHSYI